jgi:hypothetical protein
VTSVPQLFETHDTAVSFAVAEQASASALHAA